MVDLVPVWVTPALSLGSVSEGRSKTFTLATYEQATLTGVVSQNVVPLGALALRLTKVFLNDVDTPFVINTAESTVLWTNPLTGPTRIVLRFTPALTFTLLNGALPPGLTMSTAGVISGSLLHIAAPALYTFTVRISNGTRVRDRTFTIDAVPRIEPATFYYPTIRPLAQDPSLGLIYKDLGTYSLDDTIAYGIDLVMPSGVVPPMTVDPTPGVGAPRHAGLPRGLELDGTTIGGVIAADACLGDYLFDVSIHDPNVVSTLTFKLTVVGTVSPSFGVEPEVVWWTPAGNLGIIPEKEPSHFAVAALATGTDETVTYTLAHTSDPLPSGLSLDALTGRITGLLPHVRIDTVYEFTIRASVGRIFADRTFSVTVKNLFASNDVVQIRLWLRQTERRALLPAYRTLIPDELVYRADDASFGRPTSASAYLINGLDGAISLDPTIDGADQPAGKVGHSYQAPFRLLLGGHRFAVARDSTGTVVYEVLFRDLIDPLSKAGGFLTNDIVAPRPVAYPQSRDFDIFPNSLNNIRRDLVDEVGFGVTDPTLRRTIGTSGPELLPLWMRSAQVAGDAATVPGFTPSIVIAYLKPGSIAAATKILNDDADLLPPVGAVYHFDQYIVSEPTLVGATTFDGEATYFDDRTTLLEAALDDEASVKYLNNPRA